MKLNALGVCLYLFIFIPFKVFCVEKLFPKIITTYPHNIESFTQGLVMYGENLFESCGKYGHSKIRKVDLTTGRVLQEIKLPEMIFAEGIAIYNNQLIQLTWRENKAFFYDLNTLKVKKVEYYDGEGWGLCQDGDTVWMSNGSSRLVQRHTDSFKIIKCIDVKMDEKPVADLNDLYLVGEYIYANVWNKDWILKIDKKNGQVVGLIDCSSLLTNKQKKKLDINCVLNGIAYNEERKTFLLTGKCWPNLFEVIFIDQK